MRRREYLKTMAAAAALAASPSSGWAAENKGRFRPAICAYSFRNQLKAGSMTYADVIRMASDLGADGVDLTTYWFADTNDDTLFQLKKLAYRSSISLYTIGVRVRLAQPTPELQAAELETVRKWLDVAQKLGASHMRVFGGAVPKGATEDQAVAWAVETLKRAAEESGKKGITLGVEDDGGITTNADRTIEIVKKAASPWAAINLDIGNFPDDGYTQIEMCAPFATNVHFKTAVHINKQKQPADWPRVLKILGAAGYKGYLALEYEEEEDPIHVVPKLIGKMRETIRGVMRVLEFIPGTRKLLRLLASEPEDFAAEYGVRLHEVAQAVAQHSLAFMRTFPYETPPEWFGYFAVEGATQQLVGMCSFKGPAVEGAVEIAYFTFPGFEGRGIGTEMARFLLERARLLPDVTKVIAHTSPESGASSRILEKIGMRFAEETEEDGAPVWQWELPLGSPGALA